MRGLFAIALTSALMLQVAPLVAAPATGEARGGAVQSPETGVINGISQDAAGQTLPHHTVQVRNLQTGQLVSTTTSDAAGTFSFTGLDPATYVVELVNSAGEIVGSSASIAVGAGAAVPMTVSLTTAAIEGAVAAGATAGGISAALAVTAVAAAAGIAGVVVVARDDASPSQ